MSNYRRGVEAERKTMAILRAAGYEVLRTAGSHGPWDVIGIGPADVVLVQVKRGSRPPGRSVLDELAEKRLPGNVRQLVHYWPPGAGEPEVTAL